MDGDTSLDPERPLIRVLDRGFVELVDVMGDDRRCVAAARVSLRGEAKSLKDGSPEQIARDKGLIRTLMRNRHTSPFEHAVFQFRVRAPILVARQWFRHRFASYNEESGRYVELKDEFYLPEHLRGSSGKAMDYGVRALDDDTNDWARAQIEAVYQRAREAYESLLARGVAREHARVVLPMAQYTTFFWTVNALSLMNFLNLRTAATAQGEIRAYAAAIEELFRQRMPWTHEAFREFWGVSMIE